MSLEPKKKMSWASKSKGFILAYFTGQLRVGTLLCVPSFCDQAQLGRVDLEEKGEISGRSTGWVFIFCQKEARHIATHVS